MSANQYIIFDLEQGRGYGYGVGDTSFSGFELASTWDEHNGYMRWTNNQGRELVHFLNSFDSVIGFNCFTYDYRVLSGYLTPHEQRVLMPVLRAKTIDLYQKVRQALYKGYGLNILGQLTLGRGKLDNPPTEQDIEGRWEYVERDVELTRDLYWHIKQSGWLDTPSGVVALDV